MPDSVQRHSRRCICWSAQTNTCWPATSLFFFFFFFFFFLPLTADASNGRGTRSGPPACPTCAHGQAGRLRSPRTRGARRPLRPVVVHRRAGLPEVRRGRAGRARGRLRRGHRVRRLGDRGLRPGLRGRHARQARPGDLPDPAVARRGPVDGADVLRHRDARRLPVVRRPALRAQAHAQPGRGQGFTFYTHPEIEFYLFKDPPGPATSRSRSTAAATSTTPPSRWAPTSAARRSRCWSRWASRWSSVTTRAAPASRRSTCATPTRSPPPTTS